MRPSDKKRYREMLREFIDVDLHIAEVLMDQSIKETQSKLSIVRRELKRRKREATKAT